MSRSKERLSGVFTALVTPFTPDGEVDEDGLRRLVRFQIDGGVAGLVPVGTTGEGATLEPDEHVRVVAVVAEAAREAARASGRPVTILAGAGTNSTAKTVELARRCQEAGADALLIVTPYYNKPTAGGQLAHFRAVADAVDVPIVIYNVPGRTGTNMTPQTILELAADPRFAGVKEASGNLEQASEILRRRPEHFAVLSGEDSLTLPLVALGADGVVAVVSNEVPDRLVELVEAALAGARDRAARLHAHLFPLMRANFLETNPIPVKWAVARMGLIGGHLRLPLTPLSPAHEVELERILRDAGALEGEGRRRGAAS